LYCLTASLQSPAGAARDEVIARSAQKELKSMDLSILNSTVLSGRSGPHRVRTLLLPHLLRQYSVMPKALIVNNRLGDIA